MTTTFLHPTPAPSERVAQGGQPWRWDFGSSEDYVTVRYSREHDAVLCCLNGKRIGDYRPRLRAWDGGPQPAAWQLRVAIKAVARHLQVSLAHGSLWGS